MAKAMEKHSRRHYSSTSINRSVWRAGFGARGWARADPGTGPYSTNTVGAVGPVMGLLTPPIRSVTGSAPPFKCVPGIRQLIW